MNTPEYIIELYDIHGNFLLDISRFTSLSYTMVLNDAETAKFDLDLDAFEQLCHSIGLAPRNVLYPARTEVRIKRGDHTMLGLRIVDTNTQLSEGGKKLSVSCDGYLNYFARRLVYPNAWSNTERSLIAWQAIDAVQALQYGNLGVTQGELATVGATSYLAEYESVKKVIQDFTTSWPHAYDFEITPSKVFNTYTRKGSDKPHIELQYSGVPQNPADTIQSFTAPRQSDTMANKIIGIGKVNGVNQTSTQNKLSAQADYRIIEQKVSMGDFTSQQDLADATAGVLEESYNILVVPEVKLYPGALDLSTIETGDAVQVKIEQDAAIQTYNNDIDGLFRISKIDVTVDQNGAEEVSLAFFNPSAGGEI